MIYPNIPTKPLLSSLVCDQYLEGQGDITNGLILGINKLTIWIIGVLNLLMRSRDHFTVFRVLGFRPHCLRVCS